MTLKEALQRNDVKSSVREFYDAIEKLEELRSRLAMAIANNADVEQGEQVAIQIMQAASGLRYIADVLECALYVAKSQPDITDVSQPGVCVPKVDCQLVVPDAVSQADGAAEDLTFMRTDGTVQ